MIRHITMLRSTSLASSLPDQLDPELQLRVSIEQRLPRQVSISTRVPAPGPESLPPRGRDTCQYSAET